MLSKQFLEHSNLYQKFKIDVPKYFEEFDEPTIHLYCEMCKSDQTFNLHEPFYPKYQKFDHESAGEIIYLDYICTGCKNFHRVFSVKVDENLDYLMKIGQYPPIDISIEKNISKALGEHKELYKKGLICESQGYGIGAYAYYRRIVELIIDELLDDIYELIEEEGKSEYKEALDKTKQTTVTQTKIELVKDLLPSSLKPDGLNPLGTLHEILSEGIHSKPDEECIEFAEDIKTILIYLVSEVIRHKQESKMFTDKMHRLLEKKSRNT